MKILIAEDDPVSRRMLEVLLKKWDYEVVVAKNGAEAWQFLQAQDAPRLALLDWMMPEINGVQVCREVRKHRAEPYTYILLLTAKDQKQDIVEGIEAGADDYLTKPFEADELKARLRAGIRILTLQESLISARDVLQFQATHDGLTGLWNRAAILDVLHKELARAARQKIPVTLVMGDVDHFKQINDTHGHAAGDAVLREVARRMTACVRSYDSVGRFGGEEFLLVLTDCDEPDGMTKAEKLRTEICNEAVVIPEGNIPITLSSGVAVSCSSCQQDPTSFLRNADDALYRAKANGRNRVELAVAEIPPMKAYQRA